MTSRAHLAEGDLFLLAFPPSGEPGPLPPHLAECEACERRFAEWERAAREIAGRPEASTADFERAVMARVRALPRPGRRAGWPWKRGLAAAAIVAGAFWIGSRTVSRPRPPAPERAADAAGVSGDALPRDVADDALLREISRVVDGEEGSGWKRMAPLPADKEGRS